MEKIAGLMLKDRINMAAWSSNQGVTLLGRRVREAGQISEPDWGQLVAGRMDGKGFYSGETQIWDREGGVSLEDPRVARVRGELVCGMTAVVKEDGYRFYPAVAKIEEDGDVKISGLKVLTALGLGKNTTPVGDSGLFLYRPDGSDHKLVMFYCSGGLTEVVGEVPFAPIPRWGEHRMGMGMPPIWHEDGCRAMVILHGMTYDVRRGFYSYNIGRGFLRKGKDWWISVCPDPLFNGEDFAGWPQLHPELRLAIYNTGGVIVGDRLRLFINVGDKCTIARDVPLAKLWKEW